MNGEMIADAKFWDMYNRYRSKPMDEAKRTAIRWMERAIAAYEWWDRELFLHEMVAFQS